MELQLNFLFTSLPISCPLNTGFTIYGTKQHPLTVVRNGHHDLSVSDETQPHINAQWNFNIPRRHAFLEGTSIPRAFPLQRRRSGRESTGCEAAQS